MWKKKYLEGHDAFKKWVCLKQGERERDVGDAIRQVMGPDLWMAIVRIMVNLGLVESL